MNNSENFAKLASKAIATASKDRAKAGQSGLTALIAGVVWAGQTGADAGAVKAVRAEIEAAFIGSYGREITALLGWTALTFRDIFSANLTASFDEQVERAKTSMLAACRMANVPEGLGGIAMLKKGPGKAKSGGRSMFVSADEAKAAKAGSAPSASAAESAPARTETDLTPTDVLNVFSVLSPENQGKALALLAEYQAGQAKVAAAA